MNEELSPLHDEMRAGFAEMRQEFAALRQEVSQGFAAVRQEVGQELAAVRQEMGQEFAAVRQEVGQEFAAVRQEMGQEFAAVRQEMGQRFDDVYRRLDTLDERVRHDGVLLEDLRDDVRQMAEGHALLDGRVERYRQENEAAHTEILVLLRTSYRDLDHRVTRLEDRHPDH